MGPVVPIGGITSTPRLFVPAVHSDHAGTGNRNLVVPIGKRQCPGCRLMGDQLCNRIAGNIIFNGVGYVYWVSLFDGSYRIRNLGDRGLTHTHYNKCGWGKGVFLSIWQVVLLDLPHS